MYGDSQTLSSDDGDIYALSSKVKEIPFAKSGEFVMDSDTSYREYKQYNSGLLRFRSAPSSLLANLSDGAETQGLSSRITSSVMHSNQVSDDVHVLEDNKAMVNSNTYDLNSQLPPQYPMPNGSTQLGFVNCGYGVQNSMGIDHQGQPKMGSNLLRQSSSPAGLFSHLTDQMQSAGYATTRGVASFGFPSGCSGDLSPSSNRLNVPMDFSSGMPSDLGMLSRISEVENDIGGTNCPHDEKLGNGNGDTQFYDSGFLFGAWNNSSKLAENFSGLKREVDNDHDLFSETQGGDPRNRPPILSHHLSLPQTAEIAAMEKLLQLQDTVPCKIRAKRGCATHPRSIAERERRTRISERMRKLQELVPNMDKQTNTADMLDFAVEYIKELQKQYETLSDVRANCKCSAMQKPVSDQMF